MKDKVLIKLTGGSVEIMYKANERYRKYITTERRKDVIYLRLDKALYGCGQLVLLWYRTFTDMLMKEGFMINKYDPCVTNKVINGSQCTICWNVDDTKISHKQPQVVDDIIGILDRKFETMVVKIGKKHVFFGVDIEFVDKGRVKITMNEYINECMDVYGKDKLEKGGPQECTTYLI